MTYDLQYAQHIRQLLYDQAGVSEKVMFGGLVFMINRAIVCGLVGDALLVRIGTKHAMTAAQAPHVRPFQLGKRQSKGWVLVDMQALGSGDDLKHWVQIGITRAETLHAQEL